LSPGACDCLGQSFHAPALAGKRADPLTKESRPLAT
jgi:hypothetical protein